MKTKMKTYLMAALLGLCMGPARGQNVDELPALLGADMDTAADKAMIRDASVPAANGALRWTTIDEMWKAMGGTNVSKTELGYLDGVTSAIQPQIDGKQATLVSGTNLKTVNGTSLLGSGDVSVEPAGVAAADITDGTATGRALMTAEDPAAARAALGDHPEVVMRSADGSRWSLTVANDGALTATLLTGPEITAYMEATGIDPDAAAEIQTMMTALDDAGVLGNLVDGAILKSRYARVQDRQVRSLRGTAPLVLSNGSVVLGDCGLIFNGANAAKATLQSHPRARSFFALTAMKQNFQTPYTNLGHPWVVKNQFATNTFAGEYVRFDSGTTPVVGSMYGTGATARTIDPDGFSRSFPPKSFFSAYTYDGNLPNYTADGFTFRNYGGTKRLASTSQNGDSHTPYWVTLGGGYYGGGPSPSEMVHCAIGSWMLFDKVLSDSEIADVYAALFLLSPRWKYVPGGDSLQQYQTPYFLTLNETYGTNVKLQNVAAGGITVPAVVAGLGTTYFSASHLAADGPVIADFVNIDDITGSYTKEQYLADLRTIWTHIKTVNPAAKIIGQTITSSEGLETAGVLADLDWLNAQIRLDVGTYYDVLVDGWQIAQDMKRPEYTYQHDDPTVIVDGVHPSAALATAIAQAKLAAIESLGISIR